MEAVLWGRVKGLFAQKCICKGPGDAQENEFPRVVVVDEIALCTTGIREASVAAVLIFGGLELVPHNVKDQV